MEVIKLEEVSRNFLVKGEEINVLKDINLNINRGEMIAIVGNSGSGKTTLLNIIGCLDTPSSGKYFLSGEEVSTLKSNKLAKIRSERFGFIFQKYHLIPHLNVLDNILVPCFYSKGEIVGIQSKAEGFLKYLGMGNRSSFMPHELSGGQQQRVAIIRALINDCSIILADEPTGALDEESGSNVLAILKELNNSGYTVIIVTHDVRISSQMPRVIEISDGQIKSDTNKANLKDNPVYFTKNTLVNNSFESRNAGKTKKNSNLNLKKLKLIQGAYSALVFNKIRTIITMLGIVVGLGSFLAMQVVGNTTRAIIIKDIENFDVNTVQIYPGRFPGDHDPVFNASLKEDDYELVKSLPPVQLVYPTISRRLNISSGMHNGDADTAGVSSSFFKVHKLNIIQGDYFKELQSRSRVAVINNNAKKTLFPFMKNVVGEFFYIGSISIMVVGVVEGKNENQGDNSLKVWIPHETMKYLVSGTDHFDNLTVKLNNKESLKDSLILIEFILNIKHLKKDFYIFNLDRVLKLIEKTTGTLKVFLSLVASISLIVGGIGVMNIMLVSVKERRNEIGIRTAVGATSKDILTQFVFESVLVCSLSGGVGLFLSYFTTKIFDCIFPKLGIYLSSVDMMLALIFSIFIGVFFGFFPALKASRLKPVNILRY